MSRLQFIDKDKGANFERGIEFFAVGLVVSSHMEDGVPNKSGKDYAVEYIDPFGVHQYCWRASEEIEVSPISDDDFDYLMACYADAKAAALAGGIPAPAEDSMAEPLAYQCRKKTTRDGSVWGAWVECSKAEYEKVLSSPGANMHGVIREVRALGLYVAAGNTEQT